jgi:hypothetical protein
VGPQGGQALGPVEDVGPDRLGDGQVVDQRSGGDGDAAAPGSFDRDAAVVLPEVLDQPQAAGPLDCFGRERLLVQDQEVRVLDGTDDLVDVTGEAQAPLVVGVELAERGVGGVGAVEPEEVEVDAGEQGAQREGDRLPARPGADAEQRVADAVPDDDLDPLAHGALLPNLTGGTIPPGRKALTPGPSPDARERGGLPSTRRDVRQRAIHQRRFG